MGGVTGGFAGGIIGGFNAYSNGDNFWEGSIYSTEMGGSSGNNPTFLDETIPPGANPTATGELAVTKANPNYGKYGMTRNGGKKAHYGVDYAGKVGDPVFAMYDGTVKRIGSASTLGKNNVRRTSVINGKTYNVDYGYLSKALVKKGNWVNAGDKIGLMGRIGIDAGYPTHVHIAVWRNAVIQGVTYQGFVQPSWNWRATRIPWEYRLYY